MTPWVLGLALTARANEAGALAMSMAWSADETERNDATRALKGLPSAEVGPAVVAAFAWRPQVEAVFVGSAPLLAALSLDDLTRRDVATELMVWRVGLTLVGHKEVPPRLEAELRGVMGPEIAKFGQPTQTTDWMFLLGALHGDLSAVIDRLTIQEDARWSYIVETEALLAAGEIRDALPLLGHRCPIVRERAADRFESEQEATRQAMRITWRFAPGRSAPLRGDIAVPELEWEQAPAERWARRLVRWARRTHRQRDDRALRATLRLLTDPGLTTVLTESARHNAADSLIRAAKRDIRSPRAADLAQAMDALIRQVPFDGGARPAPDEQSLEGEVWIRQYEPK